MKEYDQLVFVSEINPGSLAFGRENFRPWHRDEFIWTKASFMDQQWNLLAVDSTKLSLIKHIFFQKILINWALM